MGVSCLMRVSRVFRVKKVCQHAIDKVFDVARTLQATRDSIQRNQAGVFERSRHAREIVHCPRKGRLTKQFQVAYIAQVVKSVHVRAFRNLQTAHVAQRPNVDTGHANHDDGINVSQRRQVASMRTIQQSHFSQRGKARKVTSGRVRSVEREHTQTRQRHVSSALGTQ